MIFSRSAPSFLCLPERVRGIPIFLEMRALAAERPINLFQENPPLFINTSFHKHQGFYSRNFVSELYVK